PDWPPPSGERPPPTRVATIEEVERAHILEVLEATGWRVSGNNRARTPLGRAPSSHGTRMKRRRGARERLPAAPTRPPAPTHATPAARAQAPWRCPRARSPDEVADDPVELVRVLHEHEVVPALVFLEDLELRPPNLRLDPRLRLPGDDAHPAADDQRGQCDAR